MDADLLALQLRFLIDDWRRAPPSDEILQGMWHWSFENDLEEWPE